VGADAERTQWNQNISTSPSDYYTAKNATPYDTNQTYYTAQSYYSADADSDDNVVYYTPVNATAYDTNQTYYEGAWLPRAVPVLAAGGGGRRSTRAVRVLGRRWRARRQRRTHEGGGGVCLGILLKTGRGTGVAACSQDVLHS
jgi:hypothetical protein